MMNDTKFTQDGNTLTVERTFDADLDTVWPYWTEAELLDLWWAPKPWVSKTKEMDFREGGRRLYAMCGPEGEEHWCLATYTRITPKLSFSGEDAFCNEEGTINEELPVSTFTNTFTDEAGKTHVTIVSVYASEEHLKQIIDMGVKEGLSMIFDTLDEILSK
ncbi:SRPBCC family protein [Balneola vulgaris]|uniref:SRPBCC family protein n=1 Tax=Balneola vulgaris TaxID=287535 RepID=UPI001969FD6F|nr:SRPBCC domain-containing protein [Balneola vulgaris]